MTTFSTEISLEEGQALYQAATEQAKIQLAAKGIQEPKPPMTSGPGGAVVPYRGELPVDLTTLTDNQLGTYMGLLAEWGNYVNYQLAMADSGLTTAKADLGLVECKLRLVYQRDSAEDKKRSSTERDDYVGADRRYIDARSRVIYWEHMYAHLRAIAKNTDDSWSSISRRVTQRGQEVDRMNRTGSVTGGHPNLPAGPLFGGGRRQ